jgi:hypothetical protein
MSATVLSISMSLDGLVTGPNVRPDNGLGDARGRRADPHPEGEGVTHPHFRVKR